jgi:carboxyl-terminal processing protease
MRSVRRWLTTAVLLVWAATVLPPLAAATWFDSPDQLRLQAERLEKQGRWSEARKAWEQILQKNRGLRDVRDHYLFCLRRAQLSLRHADTSYRQQVQSLSLQDALQVYGEILSRLKAEYVDHEKVEFPLLFKQGLDELLLALSDPTFRRLHLRGVDAKLVQAFAEQLQTQWANPTIRRQEEAQTLAKSVAFAANQQLGLSPALVVLELACGACSSLDEYTYYLTPAQFNDQNAAWKGELIGIGIDVTVDSRKQLAICQVIPGSPAQVESLKTGDRVLRINGRTTANLSADAATELLKGNLDTTVKLEVLSVGDQRSRTLVLRRQLIHVPSVSMPRILEMGVGYLQLVSFQETTPAELDDAILKLQMAGMKVLVLDLRGNAGGLFEEARQVVERFLSSGIIVSTQGQVTEFNATYSAHGVNPLAVPLVVLVDAETASCAEMVAGAIKDNLRGRLVGKTTFGKGSIQKVRKLNTVPPSAIRMTVAKFYSPRGQPYDGFGVSPHQDVAGSEPGLDPEQDPQIQAALEVARTLALGR